jgi:amino acid adenylation domain-containing protein
MFSDIAERFEKKIALDRAGIHLTYGELERSSNNLANFLISLGATRGSIVAIMTTEPFQVITSIIAILKAGCVFVPLDIIMPEKRLQALVSEVRPDWFITQAGLDRTVNSLLDGDETKIVRLDCDLEGYSNTERPPNSSYPDDLSYIYFTSGSSGRPKGIAGRLKAIDHFIRWEIKIFALNEADRVSQLTSPSFDAFLRDIFVPLCSGGTVCVPDGEETVRDGRKLIGWIDDQRLSLVHCVPSVFRLMLNENLDPGRFKSLRHILMAGEPLFPTDVRRWTNIYGDRVQLVNLYGPSETTMVKFCYFVKPSDKDRPFIPIGKPIEGARALIVDSKARACPPKSVGEIYIRTPFRSLGYYNQPELTRESFIRNPFGNDPDDIVYKTGDLGRVLDDGNFEILGRRDQQVKIRGVRIELGEIEKLLREHELVSDVAVVDREDREGNKYLCAYVCLKERIAPATLRVHLSGHLPDYMMPSAFVIIDELPRTISGKIDRHALPAPAMVRADLIKAYIAPRNLVEELLAEIWGNLLGVPRVGIYENFFELGGHSLLATQLLSKVQETFKVEVPLRKLFESPTLAGLAQSITADAERGPQLPPIVPVPREANMPLSFAQQRLWFLDQMDPGNPAYNIASAVRIKGLLNISALEQSLALVANRHESLRTTFLSIDGQPAQIISSEVVLRLSQDDRSHEMLSEDAITQLIADEAEQPFDLTGGPLLRARLLRLQAEDHILIVTMHHIVSDGWSRGIFIREMISLYESFSIGRPSPLPALPIQYADFARWQRECLQGEMLESLLAHWKQVLGGELPVLSLPADKPKPPVRSDKGAAKRFIVPKDLVKLLKSLGHQERATLSMTMLAAFKVLLYSYARQEDLIVGINIANRNRIETEPLIGFFVNQLVVRTDLSGNPSFRELIGRIRETTLKAFTYQDLPFDKLVEELQPERDPGSTPIFKVLFVSQNAPLPALKVSGIELIPIDFEVPTSKFELILIITESEEGIEGRLSYSTDLFNEATIDGMVTRLRSLLESVATHPDARISKLDLLMAQAAREQVAKGETRQALALKSLKSIKPRLVSLPQGEIIKRSYLRGGEHLPLVISPVSDEMNLAEWGGANREMIDRQLLTVGAILFRGFEVASVKAFEDFARSICGELYDGYGDLPREQMGEKVYGSTSYPSDQEILPHNESSQIHCWPMKIWFHCVKAARVGGETPVVDSRKVYGMLDEGI